MPEKIKFSVVISVYNYGRFIETAIEGILTQDYPHDKIEIIVVDDGSIDNTAKACAKYLDRIKYIYKENGGQASALNTGFDNASGEVICFLDADDYWYPQKLRSIEAAFAGKSGIDVVYHGFNMVDHNGKIINQGWDNTGRANFTSYPLKRLLSGKAIFLPQTSAISVRSGCLNKIMPIPVNFNVCADFYINNLLPFYAREYVYLNEPLCAYRAHRNNLWHDRPDTPENLKKAIFLTETTIESMKIYGVKEGLDTSSAVRRLMTVVAEHRIVLYKLEGKFMEALKQISRWDDFPPPDRNIYLRSFFRKAGFCLFLFTPASWFKWLYGKYCGSFLYNLARGLFKT